MILSLRFRTGLIGGVVERISLHVVGTYGVWTRDPIYIYMEALICM